MTLVESLRTARLKLWDEDAGRHLHADRDLTSFLAGSVPAPAGDSFAVVRRERPPKGRPLTTDDKTVLEMWASDPPRRLWALRLPVYEFQALQFGPRPDEFVTVDYRGDALAFDVTSPSGG